MCLRVALTTSRGPRSKQSYAVTNPSIHSPTRLRAVFSFHVCARPVVRVRICRRRRRLRIETARMCAGCRVFYRITARGPAVRAWGKRRNFRRAANVPASRARIDYRGLNVENKFYVRPETACVLRYFFIIYKIRLRENGFESIIFTAFVIRKYRVDVWVDHSQTVDRVLCTYVKKRKYFSTVHPVRSVLPGGGVMGFKRSPPPQSCRRSYNIIIYQLGINIVLMHEM